MKHIVKKQCIELTMDQRLNHFHIQQLVSHHYWNDIVLVLQKVFDAVGRDGETIEIDRLEIDLGVVTAESIENNVWSASLQSKVEELLTGLSHPSSSVEVVHKPRRLNVFRQWLFYMQHGYLAWNTIKIDTQWYQDAAEALAGDIESIHLLRNLILSEKKIQNRIVSRHTEISLLRLVEIMTAEKQSDLTATIDELVMLQQYLQSVDKKHSKESEKDIRYKLWIRVLEFSAAKVERKTEQKLIEQLISSFVIENLPIGKLPAKVSSALRISQPFLKNKSFPLIAEQPVEKFNKQIQEIIDEEGIFVVNAGLVLLHPFMNSFFKRMNLLCEGKFVDMQAHQKALYLLHYLGTGKTLAEEYELLIAKVLCSYPLEETVEPCVDISDEELIEADDMLSAAIGQWEIMKNTSHAGLQESFLQRSGKFVTKNGCLILHVETRSIDMLLDYLPWNLSIVKLPWQEEILSVEWR